MTQGLSTPEDREGVCIPGHTANPPPCAGTHCSLSRRRGKRWKGGSWALVSLGSSVEPRFSLWSEWAHERMVEVYSWKRSIHAAWSDERQAEGRADPPTLPSDRTEELSSTWCFRDAMLIHQPFREKCLQSVPYSSGKKMDGPPEVPTKKAYITVLTIKSPRDKGQEVILTSCSVR